MNFCSNCGSPVSLRVPEGDHLPRFGCDTCGTIHYQNPKNVVGTVPEWDGKILLCRRAIEPQHGLWTLPAGFMENGETTCQAAERETNEEANANVTMGPLFTLINIPHIHQVHFFFRARLRDLSFYPGIESLEVQLFAEHEIPWETLAFTSVRETLTHYFADRRRQDFHFHRITLHPGRIEEIDNRGSDFDTGATR